MNSMKQKGGLFATLKHLHAKQREKLTVAGFGNKGARLMTGLESFNSEHARAWKDFTRGANAQFRRNLLDGLEDFHGDDAVAAESDLEVVTPAGMEAGAIIAASSDDPASYHSEASTVTEMTGEGVQPVAAIGSAGSADYTTAALESFNTSNLTDFVPHSVYFNMHALRQNKFSEMFYGTVVTSPQQPGLEVTVTRQVIRKDLRRGLTYKGDPEWGQRNLLDAVIDHTLLDNNSVKLIPVYLDSPADQDTSDNFVDPALVAPVAAEVEGMPFETAPLKIGKKIELVALCQPPNLRRAGMPDSTDELDQGLGLASAYLNIDDKSVVKLPLANLPYSKFMKSPEGKDRDMILSFENYDLPLTGLTQAVDSTPADGLDILRAPGNEDIIVRLHVVMRGSSNLQFGTISVDSCEVEIFKVMRTVAAGFQEEVDAATDASIRAALANLSVIGYDVLGTRSNLNKHTRGLLLDTIPEVEKFPIMLGQPLSSLAPIGMDAGEAAKIETLIAGSRVRNDNDAVTKLLNYIESLEVINPNTNRRSRVPDIEGVGRWLVRAYFEKREIDLMTQTQSMYSHQRAADVAACLVNEIRRWAYRALKMSGYGAAAEYLPGGKVKVLIGTDPEIINHIQITGDTRLVGLNLDYEMQASYDQRMYDKIVLGLSRDNTSGGVDPLTFGTFVWIPEYVGMADISREGRTATEMTVQTRTRHINHLPIMGVLEVKNLGPAVTDYITLKTDTTVTP